MIDTILAREAVLCLVNDGEFYRQTIVPAINNQVRRFNRGQWDLELSLRLFTHVASTGAKKYCKDNHMTGAWFDIFTVPTRELMAAELLEYYRYNWEDGLWDSKGSN